MKGREMDFFVFSKQIFKASFKLNFEQIFFYKNSHITK